MRRVLLLAFSPLAVALVIAGCGSGSDSSSSNGGGSAYNMPQSGSSTSSAAATGPSVTLKKISAGTALVDGQGRTLYLFEADKGTMSNCSGACASIWPPATAGGKPTAGPGVDAAKLGTTKRSDGMTELTYAGHPLYRYAADTKPGQASGEGLDQFGAKWYVLAASGQKIDND